MKKVNGAGAFTRSTCCEKEDLIFVLYDFTFDFA